MQFNISAGPVLPGAEAKRLRLAERLSKRNGVAKKPSPSAIPHENIPVSATTHVALIPASQKDESPSGLVPSPVSTQAKLNQHANPNAVRPEAAAVLPRQAGARCSSESRSLALVSSPSRASIKPSIPNRFEAAVHHGDLKERDFQTQHEELTFLRSNLPDLERTIALLKADNVRLRTELLVKGKDCDYLREYSEQMKAARDREVASLSRAREEWGKTVADRDFSIGKLQSDLTLARDRLNELTQALEDANAKCERQDREFFEERAILGDNIRELTLKVQQQNEEIGSERTAASGLMLKHSEITSSLKNQVHALTADNSHLQQKVVDWEAMVGDVAELQAQISEFKRNRNLTESRLRQELGDAAEEIHFLREEKTRLLLLVEKMELQANAAISRFDVNRANVQGSIRPLSPEEEIVSLTSTRTRLTKELQSFRDGEWSNTLGSIGKLRQHLSEEEVRRREAEDRMEQERVARRRVEKDLGERARLLEKEIEGLRSLISKRDSDVQELTVRLAESSASYQRLKSDSVKDRSDLVDAQSQMESLKSTTVRLSAQLDAVTRENKTFVKQMEEQMHSISELKSAAESLRVSNIELQGKLQSAEEGRAELETLNSRQTEHHLATFNGEADFEEDAEAEAGGELSAANLEVMPLRKVRAVAQHLLQELSNKTATASGELAHQLQLNAAAENQCKDLERAISLVSAQLARVTETSDGALSKVAALELEVASAEKARLALEEELHACQKELKIARHTISSLEESLKKTVSEHTSILSAQEQTSSQREAALKGEADAVARDLLEARAKLDSVQDLLATAEKTSTDLRKTVSEHAAVISNHEASKREMESRLLEVADEKRRVHSGITEAELLLGISDQNESQLSSRLTALLSELNREVLKRKSLESSNSELALRIDSLRSDSGATIDGLKAKLVAQDEKASEDVASLEANIRSLKQTLESVESTSALTIAREKENHEFDRKALVSKLRHAESRLKEVEKMLEARVEQIRTEANRSSELSDRLESQERRWRHKSQCDLEQMRDSYERALSKLRSQIDGADVIEDLKRKLAKAEKELRDIKQVHLHW